MLVLTIAALAATPQASIGGGVSAAPTGNHGGARLPLFTRRGAPAMPFDPALQARGVAAGDLDADGLPDLVIATADGAVVYLNGGPGGFVDTTASSLPAGLGGATTPVLADVDGDGRLDLTLLADDPAFEDVLLLGDGAGAFGAATPLPPTDAISSGAAWFDADGDGDLDLARSVGESGHGQSAGRASLVLQAPGGFVEDIAFRAAPWNDGQIATTGVVAFDANRDGRLDLFLTRADTDASDGSIGARNLLLLRSAANTTFLSAPMALPDLEDNSFGAVPTDLDGDGDLDLVVTNSVIAIPGADSGDVLINQGGAQGGRTGRFRDAIGVVDEAPSLAESIRLGPIAGDVDRDGITDVLMRVHDLPPGGDQPLFISRGAGLLRRAAFPSGSFIAAGGAFLDVDLDGDLDLVLTSAGSAAGPPPPERVLLFVNLMR